MLKLCVSILLLGVIVSGQTTNKPTATKGATTQAATTQAGTTQSQTTKRATTPKPAALACQYFDVAVKATSKLWNSLYANPSTASHMKLRWDLETGVHQLFDAVKEFNAFNLINIKKEKDDTAIHFYLIFSKNGTFIKPIEDAVAAGKIGALGVDKKFLKKECYKEPTPQPQYCPAPCSSLCMPSCYDGCCQNYPVTMPAPMPMCPPACASPMATACPAVCPPACCRSNVNAQAGKRGHVKKHHHHKHQEEEDDE